MGDKGWKAIRPGGWEANLFEFFQASQPNSFERRALIALQASRLWILENFH
jgi:hypothetical protein